jgi:uncharacterized membrane protein
MDEMRRASGGGTAATLDEDARAMDAAGTGPGAVETRDQRLGQTNSGRPFGDRPWSGGMATGPEAIESVATIDRHPIHPMLVPLPIASVVGMLACDLAYATTRDPFFARASRHLTDAALVTGLAAGAFGAMDFTGRERIRRIDAAWFHAGGNLLVMGLAVAGRMARQRDERGAVVPLGLALSAVSSTILGVTGWLGGELSYRHRVGVVPDAR